MKKNAVLCIILIPGFLLAGWRVSMASTSDGTGTALQKQTCENRIDPPLRQILADRTDTKDSVIYSTDPEMERAMEEQAREEKEKEEKAWKMLQNMNIYKDERKRSPRTQPDNTPAQ